MKQTKRRFPPQTFYDRTGIQRELEAQAQQGWWLEKCSALGWTYRRAEPKKVHYAVTYFPDADIYDPAPSEEQLRFQEFCAHTGWELVSANAQLQIFRNIQDNPIPIETDPEIEVENIHASMKKNLYKTWISQIFIALMNLGLSWFQISTRPISYLSTNFYLITVLLWLLLLIHTSVQLLVYHTWLRKARINARDGIFTETKGTGTLQNLLLLPVLLLTGLMLSNMPVVGDGIALLSVGGVLGVVGISLLFTHFMKKNGVDASTNRALSVVMTMVLTFLLLIIVTAFILTAKPEAKGERYVVKGVTQYIYHDDIPLKIEDILETRYANYSYEIMDDLSSPLLRYRRCRQEAMLDAPDEPEMDYVIVDVQIPAMREWVVEQMLEESFHLSVVANRSYQALDAAPWGAEEVYQLMVDGSPQTCYLLCYKNRIVELDTSWIPTQEQVTLIGQILQK